MVRAVLYPRKSEKPRSREERLEERAILSLESQEKILAELAQTRGFAVHSILKENESAYRPGRPVFAEVIRLFQMGEADVLMVWQLNRIARNALDGGQVIHLLDQGFLKEIVTPEKTYRNTAGDKFILSIEFAMAKKSSDDSSSNIRRDMQTMADKGIRPGKVFLGYLNISKDGRISGKQFTTEKQVLLDHLKRPLKRIEVDPLVGPQVKAVFEQAGRGIYGLTDLCRVATRVGLRTRRGKQLPPSSLGNMLRNPFYYGAFWYKGTLHTEPVEHEGLISRSLFDRVQRFLDGNGFVKQEVYEYVFAKTMTCAQCGSTITGQVQKGHRYYHCSRWRTRFVKRSCDHRKYYREEKIEELVGEYLLTLRFPPEMQTLILEALKESDKQEVNDRPRQKAALERSLRDAIQKRKNLLNLKISPENKDGELLSDEEYRKRSIKPIYPLSGGSAIL